MTTNDLEFIQSALNAYWNDAHQQLQKKDLGDIERQNYEYQLSNSKRLMNRIEQDGINTVLCGEGHNEAVIVHGDNSITNDQSQTTTLTAPNGLLPAEGLAKSVCGGTLKMCDECGRALQFPITKDFCEECA